MPLAVAAVGGNALAGERGGESVAGALALSGMADALAGLKGRGWAMVITHGNGPQVGALLTATAGVPLDILDAETQGSLGYLLQQAVGNALQRAGLATPVVSLVTRVVVDEADPAFARPSKPVGPFVDAAEAERLRRETGWQMVEDAGRGYRRVVPSPEPLEIVEWPAVQALLAAGVLVVAAGGGGIPVARRPDGTYTGVEAVVDKDRASALLAQRLSADLLLILTDVPEVRLDYGRPKERPLRRLSAAEARVHLAAGQFPPGSMGPKVEAALTFAAATRKPAVVTSAEALPEALAGRSGTWIHR